MYGQLAEELFLRLPTAQIEIPWCLLSLQEIIANWLNSSVFKVSVGSMDLILEGYSVNIVHVLREAAKKVPPLVVDH